jgi:hypothetical protein
VERGVSRRQSSSVTGTPTYKVMNMMYDVSCFIPTVRVGTGTVPGSIVQYCSNDTACHETSTSISYTRMTREQQQPNIETLSNIPLDGKEREEDPLLRR